METVTVQPNENVFQVLGVPNASFEKIRLDLMVSIVKWFKASGLSQTNASLVLGCSQPQLNDVLKHRYEKFSIERLLKMSEKTGSKVELRILEAA